MRKKWIGRLAASLVLLLLSVLSGCGRGPALSPTPAPTATSTPPPQPVVLKMGGWRTSTALLNEVVARFNEDYPHLTVQFDPVTSGEYDAVLDAQLQAGTAPDLLYLRSFSVSQRLYEEGYLQSLQGLPGLSENFEPAMLAPWTTAYGTHYGVPFTAVSHGIYYNLDLFDQLELSPPERWEDLVSTAAAIQGAGVIPFANGSKDAWTSAELVFMNLSPNFVGGRLGRQEYLEGKRCFNDDRILAAFEAVGDLAPMLPANHALLGYVDSLQLFVQGKAAMWMSGSWDIPYLEEAAPDFDWSVFPIPAPEGRATVIPFHLDVAIGLNAASAHPEKAALFLAWMTRPAFGELLGNTLPGFFPMHREAPTLANAYANTFLAMNQGRETDIRFASEKLGDGTPTGYSLIQEGAEGILRGTTTPRAAADALQAGLAQWYGPAQTCGE